MESKMKTLYSIIYFITLLDIKHTNSSSMLEMPPSSVGAKHASSLWDELFRIPTSNAPTPPTSPRPTSTPLLPEDNIFFRLYILPDTPLPEKIIRAEERLCGNICGDKFPSMSSNGWNSDLSVCQACQCDVTCIQYNNCCPDVYLRNVIIANPNIIIPNSECTLLEYPPNFMVDPVTLDHLESFTSLINKCPDANIHVQSHQTNTKRPKSSNTDIASLCERDDEGPPVSDASTHLSYKNTHCAKCHNVNSSDIIQWQMKLECNNPLILTTRYFTEKELFKALKMTEQCKLIYSPPRGRDDFLSPCRRQSAPLVRSCNQSGEWSPKFYSKEIQRACQMYTSIFMGRFKNIFCFICNTGNDWTVTDIIDYIIETSSLSGTIKPPGRLSFSALIDFGADYNHGKISVDKVIQEINTTRFTPECSQNEVLNNITCSCEVVKCEIWQKFIAENQTCQGETVRDLAKDLRIGYRACFKVIVDLQETPDYSTIGFFQYVFSQLKPSFRLLISIHQWCPGHKKVLFHLVSWVTDDILKERNNAFDDLFREDAILFCNFLGNFFHNLVIGEHAESCMFDFIECPRRDYIFQHPHCIHNGEIGQTAIHEIAIRDLGNEHEMRKESDIYWFDKDFPFNHKDKRDPNEIVFLLYKNTHFCPIVEISGSNFIENGSIIIQKSTQQQINKVMVEYVNDNSMVQICLEDYFKVMSSINDNQICYVVMTTIEYYYNKPSSDSIAFESWTIEGIISLSCSCISLIFLILTFTTYLIFDELRNKNCVNLMILIATLFVAQALYEFAMEQYENETLCSVFGVLIHYSWLASFFSMSACTIERFVKLSFPLQSRCYYLSMKPIILSVVYIFTTPVLIVGGNIIANILLENRFGYGNSQQCYINGKCSRIFSFVMPMCAILVSNIILFFTTVIKLRRQSNGKSSGSRIGLVACVRLSIVTGFAWVVSLLYESLPVNGLGYVFTALLGLQGVVLFFSLMGNRKIFGMYANLLKSRKVINSKYNSSLQTGSSLEAASRTSIIGGGQSLRL